MPNAPLIGRSDARRTLEAARSSREAELIALYGRRRVGKTFLVREFFGKQLHFELVGMHGAPLKEQLRSFARARARALGTPIEPAPPLDWSEAFQQLIRDLEQLPRITRKRVLFFDELPWLASRRSGFLRAFEHFWNAWASKQSNVIVVTCGSAAAWMIRELLGSRGGLHNRVTRRVRLEPFTLAETREFLGSRRIDLGDYQTLELYMAMGGVPHYLKEVRRGESASQSIDRICFSPDGLLRDEFENVYRSLFEHAERHQQVVRILAKKATGMSRNELLAASGLTSGGTLTTLLDELEQSGFVLRVPAFGMHAKDALYRLGDEYSLFYLRWIERHRGSSSGFWTSRRASPAWRAWSGLAFEAVCLKHTRQLKSALGIEAVETLESSWRHSPRAADGSGAQIDLVIDRKDSSINLCEMKFSEAPFVIDKAYAAELRSKRETFRRATATRKTLFLTVVTTYGVQQNAYRDELIAATVEMNALFSR